MSTCHVKSSEVAELQSAEPEKKDRKRKKKKQKHTRSESRFGLANGAWAWRDRAAAAAAAAAVSRRKGAARDGLAVTVSGFQLLGFGFSLSLSLFDSLYLYSTVQKIWGFFCFVQARCTHTARGKFWIFFFF